MNLLKYITKFVYIFYFFLIKQKILFFCDFFNELILVQSWLNFKTLKMSFKENIPCPIKINTAVSNQFEYKMFSLGNHRHIF